MQLKAPAPGTVRAMRNNRSIARARTGTASSWAPWANAGADTSWVAIATDGTYIFTLRNDGRIDRATRGSSPIWNAPYSDVGSGNSFVDMAIAIAEYELVIIPILLLIVIIDYRHRKHAKKAGKGNAVEDPEAQRNSVQREVVK